MPDITEDYQRIFGTEQGRRVLIDILLDTGFLDDEAHPVGIEQLAAKNALDNFAKGIMSKVGFWQHDIIEKVMREWIKIAVEARVNAG